MFSRCHSNVLRVVHKHLFHEKHGVDGDRVEGRESVAGSTGAGEDCRFIPWTFTCIA